MTQVFSGHTQCTAARSGSHNGGYSTYPLLLDKLQVLLHKEFYQHIGLSIKPYLQSLTLPWHPEFTCGTPQGHHVYSFIEMTPGSKCSFPSFITSAVSGFNWYHYFMSTSLSHSHSHMHSFITDKMTKQGINPGCLGPV